MKRFPFPLRFSIPAILLVFGSLLGLFSFQTEVSLSYRRTEEDVKYQARFSGTKTSGMLEYLFRKADREGAELLISQIGGDHNLQLALLCDENNRVISATHYELRNRPVVDTSAASRLPVIKRVRETMSGQAILSRDRRSIWAIYPVLFAAAPGELHSSRVGVLLLEYDLSALKERAYKDALSRSLESTAVLALLCTTVWFFFDKTLTLRAVRLVEATNNLAKGELSVRAELQGSDELAQISAAFDEMANQIQVDQQQLYKLATQREVLLNLLASQIRNSLNLESILSTAVSETFALLGVDRCQFLWCSFDDPAPSFHLSHEARLPELPKVLEQYRIEDLNNSYIQALLSFKTVRINDLTTDKFLDATWRESLMAQGYASLVYCPIQTRSGKLGLICCVHCRTFHSWSDDEVELLQSVATQLAIAIDQAELYEQTFIAAATATAQAAQLRQTLQELQQTQALLGATLNSTAEGLLVVDQAGKIVGFNKKFVKIWCIPESILASQDDNQALAFVLDQLIDPEAFLSKVRELYAQPNAKSQDVLKFKDGRIFERYSQPQRLEGKIVGRVWSFRDVTERARAEEKIRYQALHDLLTGLPNRILFNDRLSLALANAHRQQGMLAVMFMDLDRFKTINDTLGHDFGDQLLQSVAKRLIDCLREGDTVARWGGDEFTLLLPQIIDAKEAAKIAQRILEALKPVFNLEGRQLHITHSIGIALYPDDGEDAETLLKNADTALYRAKEQGRNNYQLYTSIMNSKASELLLLDNSLHYALERGEFVVYYQPQVNINTWKITRMEALLRWQHPTLGLISPGIFIPLAEENGLIVPIGESVLRTACAQNKAWQDMGLQGLSVAVNLSARQFQQPNLVAMVAQVLEEAGLEPHFLELEITETTVMHDVDFTRAILSDLQQMGVRLCMDDFGTGYSSLSCLKKFPLHTIKIDQCFIRDLAVDPYDRAITTAVIALGHGLNLSVVAEGVETKEQIDCLQSLQCEEMQGDFCSPSLSAENATELLRNAWARGENASIKG
jgi:diguanylate cyclase (GGDEF)-like protein/PAS domain S-box-containing protein